MSSPTDPNGPHNPFADPTALCDRCEDKYHILHMEIIEYEASHRILKHFRCIMCVKADPCVIKDCLRPVDRHRHCIVCNIILWIPITVKFKTAETVCDTCNEKDRLFIKSDRLLQLHSPPDDTVDFPIYFDRYTYTLACINPLFPPCDVVDLVNQYI